MDSALQVGQTDQLKVNLDGAGVNVGITYQMAANYTQFASVTAGGLLTAKLPGTVEVDAISSGNVVKRLVVVVQPVFDSAVHTVVASDAVFGLLTVTKDLTTPGFYNVTWANINPFKAVNGVAPTALVLVAKNTAGGPVVGYNGLGQTVAGAGNYGAFTVGQTVYFNIRTASITNPLTTADDQFGTDIAITF